MNWDRIQGNWKQVTGKVKEQWGKLTDDDIDVIAGRRDKLAGKIQERYGVAKDDAEKQLGAWAVKATDAWFVPDKAPVASTSNALPPSKNTGSSPQGSAMNWDRIQGNWKQVTGKAKEQWGKLTDDDLDVIAGRRDQLAGKIQERYGVAKDDAEKQLAAWQASVTDGWFNKDKPKN